MVLDLDEHLETKFNIGLATLRSLRELLDECNHYSSACITAGYNTMMLKAWETKLWNVYLEIEAKISPDSRNKVKRLLNSLERMPPAVIKKKTNTLYYTQHVYVKYPKMFMQRWRVCHKAESMLRIFANDKGMLLPNKPSAGRAIGDGE